MDKTNQTSSGRLQAYKTLCKIEKDKQFSNLALCSDVNLDERENSLYRQLVRGVLERKITLDYNLSKYLTQSIKRMKPQVLSILRIGAYQLLFMDKIPSSAAVNESVKMCEKTGSGFAKSMVNAVLRKVSQNGLCLPEKSDTQKYLSVKYSFSEYITRKYIEGYGIETAEKIMESSLRPTKNYIRKNSLKNEGFSFDAQKVDDVDGAFCVTGNDFLRADDIKKGLFHVQDLSSQICVQSLDPQKNETIIDVCAAPGGKTATIAQKMENTGAVLSYDIHPHKIKLIMENMNRLFITNVKASVRDGVDGEKLPPADRILCDVPCSGTGDAGRRPEVKYKDESVFVSLPQIQIKILENSARSVKVGGCLCYSTCTLMTDENDGVVKKFMSENDDFVIEQEKTIFPFERECDGFFYCLFRRIK